MYTHLYSLFHYLDYKTLGHSRNWTHWPWSFSVYAHSYHLWANPTRNWRHHGRFHARIKLKLSIWSQELESAQKVTQRGQRTDSHQIILLIMWFVAHHGEWLLREWLQWIWFWQQLGIFINLWRRSLLC